MHWQVMSALLAFPVASAAMAEGATRFEVVVNLTPTAAETLGQAGEAITVSAWYYADPRPGSEANANPIGVIDLGTEELALVGMGGTAALGLAPLDTAAYADIGGPVFVNINVVSARRTAPENLLSCDFFDGPVSRAAAAPVALRCGLIEEAIPTRAKS